MLSFYLTIKFVHMIAAMVYFGLPFTFARWCRTYVGEGHEPALLHAVTRIKWFTFFHMNLCAAILLATGSVMARQNDWFGQHWVIAALVLTLLTTVNLNLTLGVALHKQGKILYAGKATGIHKTLLRITIFSAIHHTLVTVITALMIFKPVRLIS